MINNKVSISLLTLLFSILFLHCCNNSNHHFKLDSVRGSFVENITLVDMDTLATGGWDSGIRPVEFKQNSVIYDCTHYLECIAREFCGDSIQEVTLATTLIEITNNVEYSDSSILCLKDFKLSTLRDDSTLVVKSSFSINDTFFCQNSIWKVIVL